MSRLDRMITTVEVEKVIEYGEIIEDYPEDARGKSCLMAYIDHRPVHVVCTPKDEYLAIITAYIPDLGCGKPPTTPTSPFPVFGYSY